MPRGDDIEQRLAFLDITAEDIGLLGELRPLFEKCADDFVAAFYRHLLAFAPTRQLLRDPAVKERLLLEQRAYLLSLPGPRIDAAYLEDRRRFKIGRLSGPPQYRHQHSSSCFRRGSLLSHIVKIC